MELNEKEKKILERSNNHILIDIDEDVSSSSLAARILNKLPPKPSSICYIYRVPDNLRIGNEDRYEPSIVSIGPYHHNMKNFKVSEKHKKWYLCDLISRSKPAKTCLKDIVRAIKDLEEPAREFYAEEINLSSDDFVTMMVVDGCFILELVYKWTEYMDMYEDETTLQDPIFGAPWIVPLLQRDLVLLENQIPYIVLKCLFELTMDFEDNLDSLRYLVIRFLMGQLPTSTIPGDIAVDGKHILDLVRNFILPPSEPRYNYAKNRECSYPCATDLREIGVKLKKKRAQARGIVDIKLNKAGFLKIPCFYVGEAMTGLMQNLIALEQCHASYKGYITSYAMLLCILINSKEDVKLLRSVGILNAYMDQDEKIATEINSLCKGVKLKVFYYQGLYEELHVYSQSFWHRRRAALRKWNVIMKRDYFSSPWAIISFLAAISLLVLTFIQTLFSVLSYSSGGSN